MSFLVFSFQQENGWLVVHDLTIGITGYSKLKTAFQNFFRVKKRTAMLMKRIIVISTSVAAHASECHSS